MPNPFQKLSIVEIFFNGEPLPLRETGSFRPGGFQREAEELDAGIYFAKRPTMAVAEIQIIVTASTDLESFRQADDATVIVKLDTGQSWSMNNAWIRDPVELRPGDGVVRLVFCSNAATTI